jgi:hypothetical protein
MPDRREHRGMHPKDAESFGASHVRQLRDATFELSWLLERGYQLNSALKLSGDRHALTARQRAAVSRCACPETRAKQRMQRMLPAGELAAAHRLDWDVRLVPDPDVVLRDSLVPVASADGEILDSAAHSCNLARLCVERMMPDAFVLDLGPDAERQEPEVPEPRRRG